MLCGSHNHDVVETLVGHPHVGRLKTNEKIMLDDMKKSMIKPKNSLLILKEHNKKMLQPSIVYCQNYMTEISKRSHNRNATFYKFVKA